MGEQFCSKDNMKLSLGTRTREAQLSSILESSLVYNQRFRQKQIANLRRNLFSALMRMHTVEAVTHLPRAVFLYSVRDFNELCVLVTRYLTDSGDHDALQFMIDGQETARVNDEIYEARWQDHLKKRSSIQDRQRIVLSFLTALHTRKEIIERLYLDGSQRAIDLLLVFHKP